MLDGTEPSNLYALEAFAGAHAKATQLGHAALREDHQRRRLKKIIQANNQRESEDRRLMLLGRAPADLVPIYADIDARLEKELAELDAAVAEEQSNLDALLAAQRDEKLAVHRAYRDEVVKLVESFEEEAKELTGTWERDMSTTAGELQRNDLSLQYAADISAVQLRHQEHLYQLFKRQMTAEALVEKAEDDLRQLQQTLQQEREALENSAEAQRSSRFEELKQSQLQVSYSLPFFSSSSSSMCCFVIILCFSIFNTICVCFSYCGCCCCCCCCSYCGCFVAKRRGTSVARRVRGVVGRDGGAAARQERPTGRLLEEEAGVASQRARKGVGGRR